MMKLVSQVQPGHCVAVEASELTDTVGRETHRRGNKTSTIRTKAKVEKSESECGERKQTIEDCLKRETTGRTKSKRRPDKR